MATAVGQGGFESIIEPAVNIDVLIDDEPAKALPDALVHDTSLAVVNLEPFFAYDRPDPRQEGFDGLAEPNIAGKCEIVRVACVIGPQMFCRGTQASIQMKGGQIGQGGRCGGALWQMWGRIEFSARVLAASP